MAYQTLDSDKVRLFIERHRRTISIDREILFDPESVKIKPEAERFLKGLAAIIEDQKYRVTVNGHTDDIPPAPGGQVTNNWALSGLRAVEVVKFLIEQKIAPQRLAAYGYGPISPLSPNTSADNRAMNHRVDIVLDESLAGPVSDLKVREAPGKIRYKGFTFDILGQ
ncbi:MAG: OmpA family protein [Deltaproteobacteria bacterium]|nr:OmpA family protein [Deltaproteobacteria bacterium]